MTRKLSHGLANVLAGLTFVIVPSLASAANLTVSPSGLTVRLGQVVTGNVKSLIGNDDNALVVRRFIVPSLRSDAIDIRVSGKSTASRLLTPRFTVKSESLDNGVWQQSIDLYDFTRGVWVTCSTKQLGIEYSIQTAVAPKSTDSFVSPTGMLAARVRIRMASDPLNALPAFAFEYADWALID